MGNLVLIIDPDDTERRYIATILAADGFDLLQVAGLIEGMVMEMAHGASLIVLAEDTGPVRVEDVIALIRRLSEAPLMIVGPAGGGGELAALRVGGDYYLERPSRAAELAARARSLIHRGRSAAGQETVRLPTRLRRRAMAA